MTILWLVSTAENETIPSSALALIDGTASRGRGPDALCAGGSLRSDDADSIHRGDTDIYGPVTSD